MCPAGATSAPNCSLCRAGTYGTGSGQGGLYLAEIIDGRVLLAMLGESEVVHLLAAFCMHWQYRPSVMQIMLVHQLVFNSDDMACRRDGQSELQPVPGGDVLDWIRSVCC